MRKLRYIKTEPSRGAVAICASRLQNAAHRSLAFARRASAAGKEKAGAVMLPRLNLP